MCSRSCLFGFFVTGFVLYLSVEFLKQVWKIFIFNCSLYCFPIFLFFCRDPLVGNALLLCGIYAAILFCGMVGNEIVCSGWFSVCLP